MSLVYPTVTLFSNAADRDGARQHVRQRQEHQHALVLAAAASGTRLWRRGSRTRLECVSWHALGPAGGAGGVDQRGRIVGLDRGQPGLQFAWSQPTCPASASTSSAGVPSRRCAAPCAARAARRAAVIDLVAVRVGFGERQHRAGILQNPAHLLRRRRLVDRHGDRADGKDREIQDGPFVAGGRENGHPVARPHTLGDQAQRSRPDLGSSLRARDIGPRAVHEALKDRVVGIVALVGEHRVNDAVVFADGEGGRST